MCHLGEVCMRRRWWSGWVYLNRLNMFPDWCGLMSNTSKFAWSITDVGEKVWFCLLQWKYCKAHILCRYRTVFYMCSISMDSPVSTGTVQIVSSSLLRLHKCMYACNKGCANTNQAFQLQHLFPVSLNLLKALSCNRIYLRERCFQAVKNGLCLQRALHLRGQHSGWLVRWKAGAGKMNASFFLMQVWQDRRSLYVRIRIYHFSVFFASQACILDLQFQWLLDKNRQGSICTVHFWGVAVIHFSGEKSSQRSRWCNQASGNRRSDVW